ncbi:protein of unknown function [Shewanella benthica]|uniref:Uncharacterized protein n=1 Tax=Shewanella benthica TaxID=43661 RepID=A0A330M1R5_9GAMM|nr:protein of unknown function [Shewanella benthica]
MPHYESAGDFVNCGFIAFWHTKTNQIMDERLEPKVGSNVVSVFENDTGLYTQLNFTLTQLTAVN